MTSDRLFKFSSCGVMFLGSCVFFFILFGGKVDVTPDDFKISEGFNIFLSLFFGTPIVGIIISTITFKILFVILGYKYLCYKPTDIAVINGVVKHHPVLEGFCKNPQKLNRGEIRRFFPFYQVELRRILKDDMLGFLDRRWSAANTQTNNVAAILFALTFMLIMQWESINTDFYTWLTYQQIVVVVLIFYVIFSIWNIFQSRWEGAQFEHIALADHYRREIISDQKGVNSEQKKKTRHSNLFIDFVQFLLIRKLKD